MKSLQEYIMESRHEIDWTKVADNVFPIKARKELINELDIPSDVRFLVDGKTIRKGGAPQGKWVRFNYDAYYSNPNFIALNTWACWDSTDDASIWFDNCELTDEVHRGILYIRPQNLNGTYPTGLLVEVARGGYNMSHCNIIHFILDYTDPQVFNVVKEMYPKITSVQEIL